MTERVAETALEALSSAKSLLQSPLWAHFKSEFGWRAQGLVLEGGAWAGSPILALSRRVAPGVQLCYVPYAPPNPAPADSAEELYHLASAIMASQPGRTACVRFDLPWEAEAVTLPTDGAVVKAPVDVQPRSTVILDLSRSPDELLAEMHKKNRYNVRLAERKGVAVREVGGGELHRWYELYLETARRDRITIHPLAYYQRLFELAGESPETSVHLYLAEHENDLLAGIVVVHFAEEATYLYGASSNTKRNLMPNYALQWRAILRARADGMRSYDLFGIPSAPDPGHPMYGLYRFKVGFGGRLVDRVGCWDVAGKDLRYRFYTAAERLRSLYYHRLRKLRAR